MHEELLHRESPHAEKWPNKALLLLEGPAWIHWSILERAVKHECNGEMDSDKE